MTACALYRHYDESRVLLYVGVTNNPSRRMSEHSSRSVWAQQIDSATVQWMPSREAALEAERIAIRDESPIFNGGFNAPLIYSPVGHAMRDWMGENGISQSEVAASYGTSEATLSKMLAGKVRISMRFAAFVEDWSEGAVPMRYWLFGATAEQHGSSGAVVSIVEAAQ